jgi:CheY-like chemotaxis protein/anti-sigma regulatory factor (Ser/Thr protein kinase)
VYRVTTNLAATRDTLRADPARIQQILWNLLKNAVKFTPPSGAVHLATRDEAGDLVLEVSDNGRGLAPAELSRIFEPFEQIEEEGRRNDGLGLGLAISRSIAAAHGGTLEARSSGSGRGSVFTLRIKSVIPGAGQTRAVNHDAILSPLDRPPRALRILLVEDEPMTARVMERMLKHHGYEVMVASSVVDALKLPFESIDLLISDIGLPDGNGLELMRRIRERVDVPGIALTGFGTDDDRRRSRAAGFVAHLTKPVDFERLNDLVQAVVHETLRARAIDAPRQAHEPPSTLCSPRES